MASRTIENDRDRKMTIMTTTFIPCGAKLPFIALIAGALFDGASWVAPVHTSLVSQQLSAPDYPEENKNVRRRSGTICYGASGISYADSRKRSQKYVGTWLVIY